MTNLLPPEEQHRIGLMYLSRFVIVGAIALMITAAIAAILISPSSIIIWWSEVAILNHPLSITASSTLETKDLPRAKILLDVLSGTSLIASTPSSELLHILSYKPAGVVVTHMTYTNHTVVLQGSAPHPLVESYRAALSADPLYSNVTVPVDSLVGNELAFSITIVEKK